MLRDDLFTTIHKALRYGLFDITTRAGATDWTDEGEVAALGEQWLPLLALLRAHTEHEDQHILRILDPYEPEATDLAGEQHEDLDDLLDHVALQFDAVLAAPDPDHGLALYRDLARFVAAYLPHLHEEETVIMSRIWARCSDEELAATRAAFMADMDPATTATTLRYVLPALDKVERERLVTTLAATAPPPVIDLVLSIAAAALDPAALAGVERAIGRTNRAA